MRLGAVVQDPTSEATPISSQAKLNADGTFLITGLRPGTVRFYVNYQSRAFHLTRVERGGADVAKGFEIAAGEQVTGVRLSLTYGAGVVRGQVQFEGGTRPAGLRVVVAARRTDDPSHSYAANVEVDELGRFVMENLSAGEYELTLQPYSVTPNPGQRRASPERKLVNVPDSGEVQVTFVFNQSTPP